MAKRSLSASPEGVIKAKHAFQRIGWTQEYLAAQVGLQTRQSIWKFFTGKPIERHIFIDLCFQLDLEWQEIAQLPGTAPGGVNGQSIDTLQLDGWVQRLRSNLRGQILAQCSTLQSSFDVTQPLQLSQTFTGINTLGQLTNQRWLEISDLQDTDLDDAPTRFTQVDQNKTPGMETVQNHDKLVLLGKPGAGKTTFLQHIALECQEGRFKPECMPIFIPLRIFASSGQTDASTFTLLSYIQKQWSTCGLKDDQIETLLQQGRALVLLDGLDEVSQDNSKAILHAIQDFAEQFYRSQVIVTCRIAAQQYHFRGFTYVELADFTQEQIDAFARRYFVATASNSKTAGLTKANQFLEQLRKRENQPIRELVVTPILLSLICSVFQERSTFPSNRAKLYQAALDILLVRWDQARGLKRDDTYRQLSRPDKVKLISQIAAITFEQSSYYFEKQDVLQIITDYLLTTPSVTPEPEQLWLESEAILSAIVLQHGLLVERAREVYSFSHLTFQEYLTARKMVATAQSPDRLDQSLADLATHLVEPRWREVILLTTSMLPKAELMLSKLQTQLEALVTKSPLLQTFLMAIEQKVNPMTIPCEAAALRAFYFSLWLDRDLSLATALEPSLANELPDELALDVALTRAFNLSQPLLTNPTVKQILNLSFALELESSYALDSRFLNAFQALKHHLPDPGKGEATLQEWWQTAGSEWVADFQALLVKHRLFYPIGQWATGQQEQLQQYYNANQLLVECWQADRRLAARLPQSILTSLLQPLQPVNSAPAEAVVEPVLT